METSFPVWLGNLCRDWMSAGGVRGTQRIGQMFYNRLDRDRPEIAAALTGSLIDPFYRDELSSEMLLYVADRW